jgi:hypothetical protein
MRHNLYFSSFFLVLSLGLANVLLAGAGASGNAQGPLVELDRPKRASATPTDVMPTASGAASLGASSSSGSSPALGFPLTGRQKIGLRLRDPAIQVGTWALVTKDGKRFDRDHPSEAKLYLMIKSATGGTTLHRLQWRKNTQAKLSAGYCLAEIDDRGGGSSVQLDDGRSTIGRWAFENHVKLTEELVGY